MNSQRAYKYYDLLMGAFITVLLCSHLIGAGKVVSISGVKFGAGVLFFPLTYVFGDILTEVYGYARARKVVWAGFTALIFTSVMSSIIVALPAADNWKNQDAYIAIFGQTPRIVMASLTAFWFGEFINSYVMAKLKITTDGRHLWLRTIGSTIIGQAFDSLLFFPLAFWGIWPPDLIAQVMLSNYLFKVGWETLLTPVTYKIVNFLKKTEQEDFFDRDTNFSPFGIKT